MSNNSKLILDLMEILGLPKGTRSFALKAAVNETVTVTCEYYPDDQASDTIAAKYHLILEEIKEEGENKG